MGKIKIMAKYRLVGKTAPLFFIFSAVLVFTVILGDFSFIIGRITDYYEITFKSETAEKAVPVVSSLIGVLLFLLTVPPLRLGVESWFLKGAKGEKASFSDIFGYFSPRGIRKSVAAVLFCAFRKTLALILFLFPSLCLFGVIFFSFDDGEISLYVTYALLAAAVLLLVLGLGFYFVYSARYFAYYSIIVSNETIKAESAYEKSIEITKGAYGRLCLFRLSFLPWVLLCVLVFPAFYVWGYYKQSKVMLSFHNDRMHT